jgi:hypothetical protein
MAKPTRQEYLKQQAAKLPPAQQKAAIAQINAANKGGITKEELTKLDAQFNTVLYGASGMGGTAGVAPFLQQAGTTAVTGPTTTPNPYAEQREFDRKSAFTILEDTFKNPQYFSNIKELVDWFENTYKPKTYEIFVKLFDKYIIEYL